MHTLPGKFLTIFLLRALFAAFSISYAYFVYYSLQIAIGIRVRRGVAILHK